ncbi:MFS transporter [Rivibacter subsaxonicus]|uniref:PAT family beta-lactamase induction signal transducer AmpG n=1 Tax=Rivibacter subsaxonicus TaxID=457575 RepID=A0A4Q7VXF5_9BURK|nr:MFS transporter [Rivibacter subsaxonicus]RZU01029.1 PAT family beta-lactamase induction signal transducer AmpG [Rivibacter subsaxonicus]
MSASSQAAGDNARNTADKPTPAYRRKLFWVALLYFSEGLPLGVFYDLFPVYFRQQGVSLADIGLLSLLGLAWTVKFLWAPAVDWARHHRRWIAAANLGMAAVMCAFALGGTGFGTWVWWAIGCFTLLSATNDIATDGYTIELLDRHEYGMANGFRIGFYRAGMLAAGVLLIVSGWYGWTWAWALGAAVFVVNGSAALLAPREKPRAGAAPGLLRDEWTLLKQQPAFLLALGLVLGGLLWPVLGPLAKALGWSAVQTVSGSWWFKGALPVGLMFAGAALLVRAAQGPRADELRQGPVFGAWVELLARPGMVAVLVFILTFKLGDAAMGFMVKPFWVDAGFTAAQIGVVSVNLGLGLSIAGGLIGGWYVDRVGIFKGLWVLGLWQALSNLGYAAAASVVPLVPAGTEVALQHQLIVYSASALESFTGGLGTGAFLAFLMAITSKQRATTEYAILSSIFAFSRAVAGWAGGIGAQEMGYANYFFLTFWLSFPAYFLLPAVKRMLERPPQA